MTADPTMIPKTIRPTAERQTLLVPKDRIDEARDLGAAYDQASRTWTVPKAAAGQIPRNMPPGTDEDVRSSSISHRSNASAKPRPP